MSMNVTDRGVTYRACYSYTGITLPPFSFIHFKFFIHGGPINQKWLLFRGPWKKPNYNVTKINKKEYLQC